MTAEPSPIDELGAWRARPGRVARAFNAAPAWLYRLGLGWLLPGSVVLIVHRGRKSGKLHRTCVEVVYRDEAAGEITVFSSRGARSDWYRNLAAAPVVELRSGRRRLHPEQRFLGPDEALTALREFAKKRPAAAKRIVPSGSDAELAAAAQRVKMVAFRIN